MEDERELHPHRLRTVMKLTRFTPGEWREISRRLSRLRKSIPNLTWQEYSNKVTRTGSIRVIEVPYDPHDYLRLLYYISNNINQLAHLANQQGGVDQKILERSSYLVAECVGVTQSCVEEWNKILEDTRKDPQRK